MGPSSKRRRGCEMCKRQVLDRKARHIKFVDSHRIRRSFASTISVWWCRTLSILGTTHTLASVLGCLSESCMGGVHTHKQRKGDTTLMNDKRRRQDQGCGSTHRSTAPKGATGRTPQISFCLNKATKSRSACHFVANPPQE